MTVTSSSTATTGTGGELARREDLLTLTIEGAIRASIDIRSIAGPAYS